MRAGGEKRARAKWKCRDGERQIDRYIYIYIERERERETEGGPVQHSKYFKSSTHLNWNIFRRVSHPRSLPGAGSVPFLPLPLPLPPHRLDRRVLRTYRASYRFAPVFFPTRPIDLDPRNFPRSSYGVARGMRSRPLPPSPPRSSPVTAKKALAQVSRPREK